MVLDDATYFTRRALWQIDRASDAADGGLAEVHVELTSLYLKRALSHLENALEGPSNVLPMRIVA